ncbi:hypothetical protein EXN66_Car007991 [Channa argus]|uniref:Uncharacterized protein n=1 Tax=Channa argus TaxID=215402 RepID=A0A6G1PPW3_CHAAH|nr:hypothetical protein EXN66_Car007991 [Channa argus]
MDVHNLDKSYNRPYIRPSYLRPRPSELQLALIRADWLLCSLTSDMGTLQGRWVIVILFFPCLVSHKKRKRKKENTDMEKARQDLTFIS